MTLMWRYHHRHHGEDDDEKATNSFLFFLRCSCNFILCKVNVNTKLLLSIGLIFGIFNCICQIVSELIENKNPRCSKIKQTIHDNIIKLTAKRNKTDNW